MNAPHETAVTPEQTPAPQRPTVRFMLSHPAHAIALGGVLTLFIAAPPNGSSVWVRAVNEVTGAVFEQEITTDLPANTQFLSPRLFLNTGATAAAVAYDCAGLYLETDY